MNLSADTIKTGFKDLITNKKLLIKILVIILILLSSLVLRIHEAGKADITVEAADEVSSPAAEIYVDISGAVNEPGVYKATPETRLYEVIEMAGGLRSDANVEVINQAEYVEDGEKIIIPVIRQDNGDAGGAAGDDAATSASSDVVSAGASGLVNINTATAEELKTLNGIGDVIAGRIIEYRSTHVFSSIEDIKSVKGIGDSIFDSIKDDITI